MTTTFTRSFGNADNLRDVAVANAKKHHADAIQSQHVIVLTDALDADVKDAAFRAAGLEPRFKIATGRFAFWKRNRLGRPLRAEHSIRRRSRRRYGRHPVRPRRKRHIDRNPCSIEAASR